MKLIRSMILPLQDREILLPDAAVAEVIPLYLPDEDESSSWNLGKITWRGINISLVSFEALNNESIKLFVSLRSKIAVLNRCVPDVGDDFFAVILQDLPRLFKIGPDDLKQATESSSEIFYISVFIEEKEVFLVDLGKAQAKIFQ